MEKLIEEELNKEFCKLILKDGSLKPFEEENLKSMVDVFRSINEKDSGKVKWHVPYDMLAEEIYNLKLDIANFNKDEYINKLQEKLDTIAKDDFTNKVKSDVIRDVSLAINQKIYIDKGISKYKKEVNNISNIKNKIYSDFITILGIFTAITFATFGGLQLIGNVFGNIKYFSFNSIGATIVLGAVFTFFIYIILLILFMGISKLSMEFKNYEFTKQFICRIILSLFGVILIGVCLMIMQKILNNF